MSVQDEKVAELAAQIRSLEKEKARIEKTYFTRDTNRKAERVQGKIDALRETKERCEAATAKLSHQSELQHTKQVAAAVREAMANVEKELAAESRRPRWTVLEACPVRAAVEEDAAPRPGLSPGEVIVQLDSATVGEQLHLRFDRGWVSTEFLEPLQLGRAVGATDADARLARVKLMQEKLQAAEAAEQRIVRARQLCAWAKVAHGRLAAGCAGELQALAPAGLVAAAACRVAPPLMSVVRRTELELSADEEEQREMERTTTRAKKAVNKQLERARKKFKQIDTDGNGTLDRLEMLNLADWVFQSFHPGGKKLTEAEQDMEVAKIMQSADTDGDGLMSFEEFEVWFRGTADQIYQQQRRAAAAARRLAREQADAKELAAKAQRERERLEKQAALFRQLLAEVRQGVVVSLGLKSQKARQLFADIDAVTTPEQLVDFCRQNIKYLPEFDISRLSGARDARHFLADIPMFDHLSTEQLEQLENSLQLRTFEDGDVLMKQGDETSNEMYIVEDGECDVEINGKVVAQKHKGSYFGEIALLRSLPRTATVRAIGYLRCLELSRQNFEELVAPVIRTEVLLAQIPLLASMSREDRLALAQTVRKVTFEDGEVVMKEGDPGESMYIVTEGEAVVCIAGTGEVARKKHGDWMGEMALMNDAARTATVTATGSIECLELTRESFDQHVFGHITRPHVQTELLLAQVPLLSRLEVRMRSELAVHMSVVNMEEEATIMRQGEFGDCMYVIESGSASVEVNGSPVARLEVGNFFGEQALLNDTPRSATIVATAQCRLLKLCGEIFRKHVMSVMSVSAKLEMMLTQVPLLSKLERGTVSRLAQSAIMREYKSGAQIIKQGAIGESVFIVEKGECVVTVDDVGEVGRKQVAEYFGEQSLLQDAPRNATVTACDGGVRCIELSRNIFEQYVSNIVRVELLLGQVAILASLNQEVRLSLARRLELVSFKHGVHIVEQGQTGDCMFIMEEGECIVSVSGQAGEVARLVRGKIFGEQALLHDDVRSATISAAGDVKCFKLDRSAFNELVMDAIKGPARISMLLAQVPLLSNIDTESRLRLAGLVGEKSFFEGEPIMRQGEKGDFMYVISEGSATVSSRAGQELARLKRGQYFGEQALLHSAPRNATVTASSLFQRAESIGQVACKCLRLSRDDFQRFVGGDLDRPEARAELLLAQVPLMSGLPLTRRKALAAAMVSRTFRDGDTIIEQGDEGDTMYVIENGRAEIHVVGVGVVAVNGRGQYFGETALLRHSKRTATVKAKGTCCCLELGQQNFNELAMDVIGPIARIELWLAHIPLLANLEPAAVRLPAFVQMALVLTPTA